MQNYGDFRAGQAQTSAVSNYEKKHGRKDGKPIEDPEENKDGKKDEVPEWAQALIDSNKTLSEKLSVYEAEKAQAQRNSQISAVAKKYGIPDFMLKDRTIPENTDLDTYFKDMKQDMSNSGFKFAQVPETAEQKQEKEASEFAKMTEADTKSIVEQQNKYFMAAGFKYNIEPEPSIEERYDVSTGVRRRGPSTLDTTNLVAGSSLPSFTPIAADLMQKTAQVAIRVEVYEKFTTSTNTTLKIKKNSLAYVGMHLGAENG